MTLTVESLRHHCPTEPGSQEPFPFDLPTLVFKVAGKMYAFCGIGGDPLELSLRCDPEGAEALRSVYPAVKPGYHLNKRRWNTVTLDGTVDDEVVLEWLDGTYERVVAGLIKRDREALAAKEDGTSWGCYTAPQRSLRRSLSTSQSLRLAEHN